MALRVKKSALQNVPDGPWYYEQLELGYNYRMTDLQAALGLSQIARLDAYVAARHKLARRYDELLKNLPVVTPWRDPRDLSGFHLYIIRMKLDECATTHREAFQKLRVAGILVNPAYIPIYRQPDFAKYGFDPQTFPEAESYYSEAISIPLYPALGTKQQGPGCRNPFKCLMPMNIALIPARGGSKRIPRKNIRTFIDRPMIAWPIGLAQQSGLFDHIVVSTDDAEIREISLASGAEVPFWRPVELSDDHATTRSVIQHAIGNLSACTTRMSICCVAYTQRRRFSHSMIFQRASRH